MSRFSSYISLTARGVGCYNKNAKSRAERFSGAALGRSKGASHRFPPFLKSDVQKTIFYDVRRLLGAGANYEQYP